MPCGRSAVIGHLGDGPKVTGPTGISVIFSEMIETLIIPDVLQVAFQSVTHFFGRKQTAGCYISLTADVGIIEGFEAILPGAVKFFPQQPVKESSEALGYRVL